MKRILKIVVLALMIASGAPRAWGEAAEFGLRIHAENVPGIGRLVVRAADEGRLSVLHDPNRCTDNSGLCTDLAIRSEIVEPQVLKDERSAQGVLWLQIWEGLVLEVGAPSPRTGRVLYTAIFEIRSRQIRVPLRVDADLVMIDNR